jgi:hypothetical protein
MSEETKFSKNKKFLIMKKKKDPSQILITFGIKKSPFGGFRGLAL